jgi:zona occludens toxin (predicted ATPase)
VTEQLSIPTQLKSRLKSVLLVAAFLVSFFSISGYVSAAQQNGPAISSGQMATAPLAIKRSVNYSASFSYCNNATPFANTFAKQNKTAAFIHSLLTVIRLNRNSSRFSLIKPTLAYPIRHQAFSADNC